MNRTVYIDIDSTIWPAEKEYDKACMELYGKPFGKDWYDVDQLVQKFGPDYNKIFASALDPDRVHNREMYEDAAGFLTVLGSHPLIDLHFLSHNPKPNKMITPVNDWLSDNIPGVDFSLTIFGARNDKVKFMQNDPSAWAIVEDKPETLVKAKKAGYVVFAKLQPWNLQVVEEYDILGFGTWAAFGPLFYKRFMFGDRVLHAVG